MATKTKPEAFCETFLCEGALAIDREAGEIRGVKLVGLESLNGRSYSPAALRKAIGLYEGAKVNVNHPDKGPASPRDYRDRLGSIHGVEYREGASPGLYGTLRYNPKHAIAEQLLWDAQNNPGVVGFSHNAEGRSSRAGGKVVVEEITKVRSVDLVADPATTISLRESVEAMTVAELLESRKTDESPLRPLLEAFMAAMPTAGDAPVPPMPSQPEGEPAPSGIREALVAAIAAAAKEAVSDQSLLDLLKQMLGSTETPEDNEMSTDTKTPAEGEKPVAEQVAEAIAEATKPLVEQLAAQQKQFDARAVLEAKGAAVNPQLVGELLECADKPAMEKLVEGWTPAKLGRPKPSLRGSSAVVEGEYPKDHAAFIRALKRS